MKLQFTKMHGIGNDYIYFNCFETNIEKPGPLAVKLSDRHFSIGGDGIVLILPSDVATAKMRMFNADGSEGKMCGNAIRCVGKFLYDHGLTDKTDITIETLSGIKKLNLAVSDGKVKTVRVDMGKAELAPEKIPVNLPGEKIVGLETEIAGTKQKITCVSMGNPHNVIFVEDPYQLDLEKIGPKYENDPLFPERVNTEFARVTGKNEIEMRVYERGSGETWACGTGACAAAVAACENGFCDKNTDILVKLRGGDLIINYTNDAVFMTGPATYAFTGEVEI